MATSSAGRSVVLFAAATLFGLAACGGADALTVAPDDGGSTVGAGGRGGSDGGSSGSGGADTPGTTTVGSGGSWDSTTTVGAAGTGGWTTTTVGTGGDAGWGGDIGSGGSGGSLGCVPGQSIGCTCASGQSGAQVCRADGTYGECVCASIDPGTWEQQQLARLRRGMVGMWTGMQTNPWLSSCSTTITFEANGHYSAHSPGDACVVFYYGSNDDSPEKTYLLNDVLPTAEGKGEIVFWFNPGNTNLGEIRHLVLSDDENQLRFEAWKTGYGPLVFTLKRVSR